jgi:hypothetical protein
MIHLPDSSASRRALSGVTRQDQANQLKFLQWIARVEVSFKNGTFLLRRAKNQFVHNSRINSSLSDRLSGLGVNSAKDKLPRRLRSVRLLRLQHPPAAESPCCASLGYRQVENLSERVTPQKTPGCHDSPEFEKDTPPRSIR